jgi:hypothetical protein
MTKLRDLVLGSFHKIHIFARIGVIIDNLVVGIGINKTFG